MSQQPAIDSTGTAIAFLLLGVAGGLGLDLCAKALLSDYSLEQFVFLRSVFGLLIFITMMRRYGGVGNLKTSKWQWHLLRTLLAAGAMFGFFFGLARMPLVNALTLGFTAPLMVTALSVPLLGEHVGWRRWTAVVFGFLGVVIILRPGAGMVTPAALAVIAAAFCYACLAITARKLSATETSYALSVYVISGPMLISGTLLPGDWAAPSIAGWGLFVLAGACSAIAWVGIIGGYRRASPAMLAPFEYTALIGGAIAGYYIWNEVPDIWVVTGGIVIIGSGLFVVYREVGSALSNRYLRVLTAAAGATLARRGRQKQGSSPE
jgi:drug/metabolite transporter (DMT)-like permease